MLGVYGSEWHRKYSCSHGTLVLTGKSRRKARERRKKAGGTERSANDRCEDNYTMEWKQDNEMPGKPPWDKEKARASSLHTTNTLFRGNCHFSDSVEDIGHLWQRTYQGLERRCEVRTHKSLANNLLNGAMEKKWLKNTEQGGGGTTADPAAIVLSFCTRVLTTNGKPGSPRLASAPTTKERDCYPFSLFYPILYPKPPNKQSKKKHAHNIVTPSVIG